MRETHDDNVDCKALANEIWKRGLKFADVVAGQYEMLSHDELHTVAEALRAYQRPEEK